MPGSRKDGGHTALHWASYHGHAKVVKYLLKSGAQVDAETKDQYTALHIAAKEGQEEVANILLEHGAGLGAATKKGFLVGTRTIGVL